MNYKEKKIFNGNFPTFVAIALSYIFFPLGIVVLAIEAKKGTLDKVEKKQIVTSFILEGASTIICILGGIVNAIFVAIDPDLGFISLFVYLVAIVPTVFAVIAMVKAFMGNYYEVPVAYAFADLFVKDDETTAKADEEKAEEKADAKAEENDNTEEK